MLLATHAGLHAITFNVVVSLKGVLVRWVELQFGKAPS